MQNKNKQQILRFKYNNFFPFLKLLQTANNRNSPLFTNKIKTF